MDATTLEQQCHLEQTFTHKKEMTEPFFNVHFPVDKVAQADRCEVWSSNFSTGGNDYNIFRLMAGNRVVAEIRRDGY